MLSWIDMFHVYKVCSGKNAARTGKAAEAPDQLFSAYDLQVSWLHFLVLDSNSELCSNSNLYSLESILLKRV